MRESASDGYYTGVKLAYILLALLLSACSFGAAQPTATIELPTAVPASPTPVLGMVLLVAPDGAAQAAEAAAAASGYAAANGLHFEQRNALTAAELPPSLQALVLLAPDPGVGELAAAAPQARIITVDFTPAEPYPNVTSLSTGAAAGTLDAAFIAGTMAAMTANDWRTGILYSAESAELVAAYRAGARYFCGACIPLGPPHSQYPIAAQAISLGDWQAAVDQLMIEFVRVVYLTPEMETSGAAQYLANYGVLLIGMSAPPADVAHAWIASVGAQAGEGLQSQLQAALAGQPPSAPGGITVQHLNTGLFSESRLSFVQTTIQELLSGVLVWQTGQ